MSEERGSLNTDNAKQRDRGGPKFIILLAALCNLTPNSQFNSLSLDIMIKYTIRADNILMVHCKLVLSNIC